MSPDFLSGPGIVGVMVVLFIVFGFLAANQKKKRRAEFQALADRLGFTMFEDGIPMNSYSNIFDLFGMGEPRQSLPFSADFISFFPLFQQGSSRRLSPAIVGSDPRGNWFLFDYQYTVSSGKNSSTYHYSAVVLQAHLIFPSLTLSAENFGHSVGKFLGMNELQVESEDFNRRYFIKTSDNKMSLDLLHPRAIETLLTQPKFEWQFAGPFIMIPIYQQQPVDVIGGVKTCIDDFFDLIPAYYRQDHSPQGAGI